MTEPWRLTLSEGIDRIKEGSLSSADWVQSLVSRIDQCEDQVKAWVQVDRNGALKAAQKVDEARAEGRDIGPLSGAPYGAKDIFDIKGLKREAGSPLYIGYVAEEDAACVARLREAGAVALGKVVTTQFANGDPSVARNPWNLDLSPGGSSAGSAAAVAAGMVPAALGSQTTGSTLRPAAFCGVVALKPTYGRIPRGGIIKVSWTFEHVGLIARSIEDLARMLEVMSGPEESDDASPEVPVPAFGAESAPRKPERVCFLKQDFLPHASAEVADRISSAVSQMKEKGVTVEEGRFSTPPEQVHAAHFIARCVDSATYHEDMFIENADEYLPATRTTVTTGFMVPAVHYNKALRLRARFIREIDQLFERYDLLVMPTQVDTPPPWEESTGDPKFNEQLTFSGHPAVTLPVGRGKGNMPIGIQIGGARFGESDLFAVARWCEEELGWRAELAEPLVAN
jgi:aspartyl-tRNA(Asn)/glutamyl-tRNA(Gln) amidotransferase subunit A